MKKSKWNLTIDIIMFLLMMAIAGLGFLMKFVLLPGSERNLKYGSGTDLSFLGLDRHEWGNIHLKLSYILLILLLLHLILHWKQVVGIFKRMIPHKPVRYLISVGLILVSGLLFLFPFMVKPEVSFQEKEHRSESRNRENQNIVEEGYAISTEGHDEHEEHSELDIQGFMTVTEVADKFGIPVKTLADSLKIEANQYGEKLGRLKRQYGFSLTDVREEVEKLKTKE